MAFVIHLQCSHCKFSVEAWELGRPYFVNDAGKKEFIPHPSPIPEELRSRIRLECDYLCMGCGKVLRRDSDDTRECPRCQSTDIEHAFETEGQTCPRCHLGTLEEDITRTIDI